jgi:hypothetical protein
MRRASPGLHDFGFAQDEPILPDRYSSGDRHWDTCTPTAQSIGLVHPLHRWRTQVRRPAAEARVCRERLACIRPCLASRPYWRR